MTLYSLLCCLIYTQKICLCEINDYDQCIVRFTGTASDGKLDQEVWNLLENSIEQLECVGECLLIFVQMDDYNCYFEDDGKLKKFKSSYQIEQELKENKLNDSN